MFKRKETDEFWKEECDRLADRLDISEAANKSLLGTISQWRSNYNELNRSKMEQEDELFEKGRLMEALKDENDSLRKMSGENWRLADGLKSELEEVKASELSLQKRVKRLRKMRNI